MIRFAKIAAIVCLFLISPAIAAAQSMLPGHAAASQVNSASSAISNDCDSFAPAALGSSASAAVDDKKTIHGFDPADFDHASKPCDDFYEFIAGGWMKNNPIPADRSSWTTFGKLRAANEDALHQILEDAAMNKSAAPGSNLQKIGDFYSSCMNEAQVESVGIKPLDPEFARIAAVKDAAGLQAEIAHLQRMGVDLAFGFGSLQDFKDSTQVVFVAGQGGLSMPDRQYYLDDDDRSKTLRAGYVQHVTNMFKLLGDSSEKAAAEAKVVVDMETAFAKAATERALLRDPQRNYHMMTLVQLNDLTPHFSWTAYFQQMGAPAVTQVDVAQPDAMKAVDSSLAGVSLDDWKTYMRWHVIHNAAPTLSKKFVEENFDFFSRQLAGTKEDLPRYRRCVQVTDGELGEALGQLYVEKYFPPEAKAQAITIIHNLMAALRDDLQTLDWMSPETRQMALHKLDKMNLKIGYPDKWRDYSAFKVDRGSYVDNVTRGDMFAVARDLNKIGKPVDKSEWGMTPPTVNAYYTPLHNEIVFPAGILQPPFFDPKASDAFNYGSMGSVIGHEMTHGFDDQGSQFDADGNLKNWWTADDLKNFKQRGDCIAKEFDSFEVEPGLHGNGKLEEGETIADLGGLVIAYSAYHKSFEGKPTPPDVDGFTSDQQFFLGFGAHWAANYRPESARLQAKTDPHPLDQFRVNGAVQNVPEFAKAWGCAPDSKMVRQGEMRCRIW